MISKLLSRHFLLQLRYTHGTRESPAGGMRLTIGNVLDCPAIHTYNNCLWYEHTCTRITFEKHWLFAKIMSLYQGSKRVWQRRRKHDLRFSLLVSTHPYRSYISEWSPLLLLILLSNPLFSHQLELIPSSLISLDANQLLVGSRRRGDVSALRDLFSLWSDCSAHTL